MVIIKQLLLLLFGVEHLNIHLQGDEKDQTTPSSTPITSAPPPPSPKPKKVRYIQGYNQCCTEI